MPSRDDSVAKRRHDDDDRRRRRNDLNRNSDDGRKHRSFSDEEGRTTRRRRRRRSPSSSDESHKDQQRRKKKTNWDAPSKFLDQQHQGGGAVVVQPQQASAEFVVGAVSKKQREIYVGNLTQGALTAPALAELFESLMKSIPSFNAAHGPAVTNTQICSNGMYAFVEFRDERLASTAMKFHGLQVAGRAIKIGRPGGYVEPPTGPAPSLDVPLAVLDELGVSGVASSFSPAAGAVGLALKKQRELYVGNLAAGAVTPHMLRQLFTPPLQAALGCSDAVVVHVELEQNGKFAFVEFKDEATATLALQFFNNCDLCGRPLRLGRPSGYVDPQTLVASILSTNQNHLNAASTAAPSSSTTVLFSTSSV